jgi:O-antigen/teichoic acid export membrane protein
VVTAAGLRGILEALQQFGWINAVRVPSGMISYVGPFLVLPFSHSLVPVVAILGIGRLGVWAVYLFACLRFLPELRRLTLLHGGIGKLVRYSSWISISNIVGPAMVYLDRFFLGAFVSIASVAYYGVPLDMVTKLWLVPSAVAGVLFPAFAATFVQNRQRTAILLDRGLKHLFLVLFPVTLVIVAFAQEGLSLWLGAEFARQCTHVLQWLSLAVFINSLDYVPFALLQGSGRPDLVAKWNLAELLPYLVVTYLVIQRYGAEGAAVAFAVRTIADTVFLFIAASRLLPESRESLVSMMPLLGLALGTFAIAGLLSSLPLRLVFVFLVLLTFLPTAWLKILRPNERAYFQVRLNTVNRLIPLLRGKA